MKKLLTKSLLVAVALLGGSINSWATPTTIYGRAVSADADNGYTAWSSADIGSGNWGGNAYYQEGEGIKMSGNGSRNTSKSFTITENALLTIDFSFNTGTNTGDARNYTTYNIGEDIQIWFNQQNQQGKVYINGSENTISNACVKDKNRNNDLWTVHMEINTLNDKLTAMTLSGRDGSSKASFTLAESVTLSHNITTSLTTSIHIDRSAGNLNTCLTSMRIQEEAQTVTSVDYTVNYLYDEEIVKTMSSTDAVGANVTAEAAIDGEGAFSGNHYLITATEAPKMTLTSGENILNVPVRAPYTATLNLTRTIGGVAQTPVVTNLVESDAKVCSWAYTYPMYVEKNGFYYIADVTTSFGESGTFTDGQIINKTVAYTNPDYEVIYYGEPNEVTGTNTAYSNGNTGYITGGVVYTSNDVIRLGTLPAGTYRLITKVTGDEKRNVVVGDCTDTSAFPTALVTITTTGQKDEEFTLTSPTPISISGKDQGSGKFNQSATIDYILIKTESTAKLQKATIGANGYTTFASTQALDLANLPEGLKAYTATLDGNVLSFTQCTQAVEAGTGLLLAGTPGTVYIPVAESGTAISDNALTGVIEAKNLKSDSENYIFAMKKAKAADDPLTFAPLSTTEIAFPIGKAYISVPASVFNSGARALTVSFGDEATGIQELKNSRIEGLKTYYDLQGRRVAQPTKGLYMKDGRKVVIK